MYEYSACMCTTCLPGAQWDQKKTVHLLEMEKTDRYEVPWGCWESKPGPLQKQQPFFITESTLQSPNTVSFLFWFELDEQMPAMQSHLTKCWQHWLPTYIPYDKLTTQNNLEMWFYLSSLFEVEAMKHHSLWTTGTEDQINNELSKVATETRPGSGNENPVLDLPKNHAFKQY